MDKTQEALKMAIEALKQACGLTPRDAHFCKAIQACKEALKNIEVGDAEIKQMLDDIEYYKNRLAKYEDVLWTHKHKKHYTKH